MIFTEIRTDLALEMHERLYDGKPDGVDFTRTRVFGVGVSRIEVKSPVGAKALGKPVGIYYTLEAESFPDASCLCDGRLRALKEILKALLPEKGSVLVVGLGNPGITPDALGPLCASMIFSTRHIREAEIKALGLPELREVCCVAPGVTGQTGLEASEIIAGICKKVKPSAVVVVDALAAGSVKRLGSTVQLSNVGIEPGSGVGNSRNAISRELLGVPVIAVGVPTVVDALSLAGDVSGRELSDTENYASFMVTPRDIDTLVRSASRFLAMGLNCVLQEKLDEQELIALM